MLEIIAIIALARKIKAIVIAKGHKPLKYILILLGLWIGLEVVGAIIGTLIFGEDGFEPYICAVLGATWAGFFSYRVALNAPDINNEDKYINSLDENQ